MTYAGLTTADKGALLDAKANGYESVVINLAGFPAEVNIDLALAQIAEMESAENPATVIPVSEKPLTWNERINQMTVEEKIEFLMSFENCANSVNPSFKCYESTDCDECLEKFLNSPYTEGATK